LKKAELFDTQRKSIVKRYNQAFKNLDFLTLPPDGEGNSWHLYIINLNLEKLDCDRNSFAKELQERGLGISMHFIPLFHFTYWQKKYPDFKSEHFPNAEKHYQGAITLPLWPGMPEDMVEYVINTVIQTGEKHHVR